VTGPSHLTASMTSGAPTMRWRFWPTNGFPQRRWLRTDADIVVSVLDRTWGRVYSLHRRATSIALRRADRIESEREIQMSMFQSTGSERINGASDPPDQYAN
jgi:hypothetical protein